MKALTRVKEEAPKGVGILSAKGASLEDPSKTVKGRGPEI